MTDARPLARLVRLRPVRHPVLVLIALLVTGTLATSAAAEINMADSVEWATADADLVVRGTVRTATATPGPGAVVWHDVTVDVVETVKGAAARTIVVAIRDVGAGVGARLAPGGGERLLFLVASARRAGDDPAYARAPFALRPDDRAVIELDAAAPGPVFTAGFAVLDRPGPILDAVRAAAVAPVTTSHRLDVPSDTAAFRALYGGSAVWMTVPVDAALERRALAALRGPDTFARVDAVRALAHFRSRVNTVRLVRLLVDPDFALVTEAGRAPVRRFLVRAAAAEVLTAWGVAHPRPRLEVPAP